MINLPPNWSWIKLGDVIGNDGVFVDGDWIESKDQDPDGGVRLIQLADIGEIEFRDKSDRYLTYQKALELNCTFLKKGDLLIARMPDPLGRACLFPLNGKNKYVTVVDVAIVRVNEKKVDVKFLCYIVNAPQSRNKISALQSGSTRKRISRKNLGTIEFPLPPLPEQKKIVGKIEELLSGLDSGVASLKKAKEQIRLYKKSTLYEAATGGLTKKWRNDQKNINSVEQLFLKIQMAKEESNREYIELALKQNKAKPKDHRKNKKSNYLGDELPTIPISWKYYRLEDLCFMVSDGTHFTPEYKGEGIKFLSVKNVRPFKIKDEKIKYISVEEYQKINSRCNPEIGDLLYTKVGATYGYAAKINIQYPFSIFVSLSLIKPVKDYVNSSFLEIIMNSELVFSQARKRVSGIGVPDLHLIEIRDFRIPFPPIEEQTQIVEEVEKRFSEADNLEKAIDDSLEKSEALRQSILKQAFEGRLV